METSNDIIESCASGLAELARTGRGGTPAAVAFAELVTNGFPVDVVAAVEAKQAHELLDETNLDADTLRISRNLWGGETYLEWHAAQFVTVDPIAANLDDIWLKRIAERQRRIEQRVMDQLEGAISAAGLTAMRAIGGRLVSQTNRVSAQARTSLAPNSLEEARDAMSEAAPYRTYLACPEPIRLLANLDIDSAIEAALEDLTLTARDVFEDGNTQLVRAIAQEAGVSEQDVLDAIGEESSLATDAAIVALGVLFANWINGYLSTRTGDLDVESNGLDGFNDTNPQIVAAVTAIAGGGAATTASLPSEAVLRDNLGQVVDNIGLPTGGTIGTKRIRRAIDVLSGQGNIPASTRTVPIYQWVYGDINERFKPYPPHVRLDGQTWIDNDNEILSNRNEADANPSFAGSFPGDHIGCRCSIEVVEYQLIRN